MPFPWPHLYEHTVNIATFTVERTYAGEDGVFCGQVARPEIRSLRELDAIIRNHKQAPVESIPAFRRAANLSRLPRPIRRGVWRLGLFADGYQRAQHFGTFCISVVASMGAASLHLLSPLTTTLNYGTFEADGSLDVRVAYDHRVLDGANMARAMAELEETLHGPILDELLAEAAFEAASSAPVAAEQRRRQGHRNRLLSTSAIDVPVDAESDPAAVIPQSRTRLASL